MSSATLDITPQITPNPNSARFQLNRTLLGGAGVDFPSADLATSGSPLATRIFGIEGIAGVYIGRDFVTVTVQPGHNPLSLAEFVDQEIRAHFESGDAHITADPTGETKGSSEIERKIIETLDMKVRPAVAMDGGDIVFAGFEDGVVKLELRGACSGCPSSLMTLKVGIENLLREDFPDDVVAVEPV